MIELHIYRCCERHIRLEAAFGRKEYFFQKKTELARIFHTGFHFSFGFSEYTE